MQADTSRVIWSFSETLDPQELSQTSKGHSRQGSMSLNLLGGLNNPPPDPSDVASFDVTVNNVGD